MTDAAEEKGQGRAAAVLGRVGRWGFDTLERVRFIRELIRESLYWTFVAPLAGKGLRVGSTFDEMVKVGVSAVPIVALISFSIGLILAMQSAYQLQQFGATIFTANLVAVAQTRELGPLMTAILVAGRSGSAWRGGGRQRQASGAAGPCAPSGSGRGTIAWNPPGRIEIMKAQKKPFTAQARKWCQTSWIS